MCVELDLTKPRPDNVLIVLENGQHRLQHFIYENLPKYCTHYFLQVHDIHNCYKLKRRNLYTILSLIMSRTCMCSLKKYLVPIEKNLNKVKEVCFDDTPIKIPREMVF